ncbi:MAG TPA: hypothetical protein VKA15_02560 [Isosphaeraceae bacterium]|nr:hypothetical protein [Isosphaeraceae bacterium]
MEAQRPTEQDDQFNPYAPPQSPFAEARYRLATGRPEFTVEDVAAWSWSIYKARLGQCVGVFWGVVTINWLCQISIVLLDGAIASLRDPMLSLLSQFTSFFVSFVVAVWLTIGQNLAFLKIARGQVVTVEDIFRGGRFVLTTILGWIAFLVVMAVPGLAVYFLAVAFLVLLVQGPTLAGVLAIVAGCVGSTLVIIYLAARLGLFYFVVIDQNTGVIASLATTWRLCRRHLATIILVYFLGIAINLAGFLMLCVGLLFTMPLSSLMLAVTYQALTGWGAVFGGSTLDDQEHDVTHQDGV